MKHIRSRRILAAVSAAALLFTSVPSGALAGEYSEEEALLGMEEAAPVAEEQEEFDQQTELPGSIEGDAAGEMDVFEPESEEQLWEDEEVILIDELVLNEDTEDPEMIVPDGIREEDEEQILPDEEGIVEAAEQYVEAGEEVVSLSVEKTTLQTCEDYAFYVYAQGADRVELAFDYENLEDWEHGWIDGRDGEYWSDRRSYGGSGTYQLVARAHFTDDNGSDYTVLSEPVTMTVTAPAGELSIRLPDELPYCLTTDSALAFELNMPEHAEFMEAEVWCDRDDGRIDLYEWRSDEAGENHAVITVTPEQLEQAGVGSTVKIRAYCAAQGYEEAEDYREIPLVAPAAADKVRISIDAQTVPANKDVMICVTPVSVGDRIEALKIWDDGGYWEWGNAITPETHREWFDSDGNFKTRHSWDRSGVKTIYAVVLLENDDNWYYTDIKTVSVTSNGAVGPFSFTLDTGTVMRGNFAEVTYGPSENADHYWVDLERWYEIDDEHDRAGWDWYGHYADSRLPGTVSFGTGNMEPGRYLVRAAAVGNGYERFEPDAEYELIITESDLEEGTVTLIVDKTDLKTREDYSFSVFAPGADWIEVAFDCDHMENWERGWIDENGGGDSWAESRSYGSSGTYQVVARAHYSSGEGDEHEEWTIESDPVTITVTSHKGKLNLTLPENLPAYLTTEDDFTFEARMPEHGENLSVNVWQETNEDARELFNDWTEDDSLTVTITKEQLEEVGAGANLKIEVSAEAYDYEGTRIEFAIPVMEEPDSDRLEIVADASDVLVNQDVRITVSSKHAEDKIRAVRLYDGQGFWEESRPERNREQFDSAGNFSVSVNWWEPGIRRVYAQVTFDGTTWLNTDVAEINVIKNGDVGSFGISLSRETAVRGELVEVTFTKADNADHYWIDIEKLNGEWCGHKADRIGEPGSAGFGTADLEPGEYRIIGKASGIGYEGRDAEESCHLTVTDSDVQEGNISLSVSKTELDTSENFAVSVYAPGAKRVEVFYDYQGEGDWWHWSSSRDGQSLEEQSNYGHSGVYSVAAKAYYYEADGNGDPVSEEVVRISEPVTMTVTASRGEALVVRMPEDLPAMLTAGEDLTFTVHKPEQADWAEVRVWYDPDDPDTDGTIFQDWIGDSSRVITVPADKLAAVKDGKLVKVRVYASALGYEEAEAFAQIPVVPAVDTEKVAITASKTDVLVNEEFLVTVSPADVGATGRIRAVRFWGGMYYFHRGLDITPEDNPESFDQNGNFVTPCPIEEPGTYSIYAMVTFDEATRQEDSRTWYTTEPIEIRVTSIGEVASVYFSLDKNRAKKDDTVTLTIPEAEHVAEYWMEVEKWHEADGEHPEGSWEYEREYSEQIPNDQLGGFRIPVQNMETGDYRLKVWLYGENGYVSCYANDGEGVELKIRDPWIEEEEEAALEELKTIVDHLSSAAGVADEAVVARALEILNSLNDAQTVYLGGEDAVEAIAAVVNAAKDQVDHAKADAVSNQLSALNENAGLAEQATVEAARRAYDSLTEDQKKYVSADALNKLTRAEASVQAAREAAEREAAEAAEAARAAAEAARRAAEEAARAAAEAAAQAVREEITISKAPSGVKAAASKKGKATITWKKFKQTKKTKAIWKKVKQVEIQYSTDKTFSTDVVSKKVGKSKTKLVVKKLKAKTTYYFRVRYIEGPLKVSKWSAVKKVKAKK